LLIFWLSRNRIKSPITYSGTVKIEKISYKRVPRLRASPRHGGADYRFLDPEIDPPRGRPFGGGGIHRNTGVWGFQPPSSYLKGFNFHKKTYFHIK
jgi:hypothetical protein